MNYRQDKYGNNISVLGFGCMRFTQTLGKIDIEKAQGEIKAAFDAGVNYYDTAYIYPGSENAVGEIFENLGIRDKVFIATKLPHYLIRSVETAEKLLNEQLRRLRTDHIDYYLMHMLTDADTWQKLLELGLGDWLKEKKKSGVIRQLGFSYHGGTENFFRLIDAYDWDFCQIQYNYMDENSQAGRRGLNYAAERKIPVVIMEPLRGGRLATRLPKEAIDIFENYPLKRTPVQWALRWLWNQPEVTCVLSGMNSLQMVKENTETASDVRVGEFSEEDNKMLMDVVTTINNKMRVGCTGCGYCMPCPNNVDIPGTFAAYNRKYSEGRFSALREHFMNSAMRKTPTDARRCIGCGKCEKHCPQHIEIRKELKNASKEIEGPIYRTAALAVKIFKAYK